MNLRVEPNEDRGFCVVEKTPEGYDIPRGWTYPTRELAEDAVPLVRGGVYYPLAEQLHERRLARQARVAVLDFARTPAKRRGV